VNRVKWQEMTRSLRRDRRVDNKVNFANFNGEFKIGTLTIIEGIMEMEEFNWVHLTVAEITALALTLIEEGRQSNEHIKALSQEARTFENVLGFIDVAQERIAHRVNALQILQNASPEKDVRDAAFVAVNKINEAFVELNCDEGVYLAVKDCVARGETLPADATKLLTDALCDYRRMGFELAPERRAELTTLKKELATLANEFEKNIRDYHDEIAVLPQETVGVSERYLAGLRRDAIGNYLVSLDYPEYGPFMQNAESPALRKALADRNLQKGGEKNLVLLDKIIKLRDRQAKLLGYPHHVAFILEKLMAKTPENVANFLEDLSKKTAAGVEKEVALLADFKRELGIGSAGDKNDQDMYYYDVSYVANAFSKARLDIDPEKIQEYFPTEHVVKETLAIYAEIFSLRFARVDFRAWHEDVTLYSVEDEATGEEIGHFFLDLYPRKGKFGRAGVFPIRSGHEIDGARVLPFVAMLTNFTKPSAAHPALLLHNEVEIFFHEFGHVIHSLLSKARFASQAGMNTKMDFVELPSQMFQGWVWDKEMLARLSRHYLSGESLPAELVEKMLAAKHFLAAFYVARQLVFGTFDFQLHSDRVPGDMSRFFNKLIAQLIRVPYPDEAIFPAGFGHLMSYDASYYSYLWSKVFACDAFSRFECEGVLNPAVGAAFRNAVLAVGASRDEMASLTEFLGRAPTNDAFLKELGLT
jgi:thimet oligopeptidase